jgi:poly(3-hydroxybutyrate) depolymerase
MYAFAADAFFPYPSIMGLYGQAANALLQAPLAMLDMGMQAMRAANLPHDIDTAAAQAHMLEAKGAPIPELQATDCGLVSTNIDGHTVPLSVSTEALSSTCDLWHFRTGSHDAQRPLLIATPYSGSRATLLKYLTAGFLPHRDVSIAAWKEPHNLPKDVSFTLEDQTEDVMACFRRIGATASRGFDAMGISQSGIPLTIAAALVSQDATQTAATPANIVIAGSPYNTSEDPNVINWIASHNPLSSSLFTPVGPAYAGAGRIVIPPGVMKALYSCTPDKLGEEFDRQALAAEHVRDMHDQIFRKNRLARGELTHRGKPIGRIDGRVGVLAIAAKDDAIVPPAQTFAVLAHSDGARKQAVTLPGGHYDLVKEGATLHLMVSKIVRFPDMAP